MTNDEILTKYKKFMDTHRLNVYKAYEWLCENTPELIDTPKINDVVEQYGILQENINNHDLSRYSEKEFEPYAQQFMNPDTATNITDEFKQAWISHVSTNPHHW